jgi:hypothetical protein
MRESWLSAEDLAVLVEPLLGMTVSRAYKSYGTTIHVELGRLQPPVAKFQELGEGEATLSMSWDWRVEEAASVLYGSSSPEPEIRDGIAGLTGAAIASLAVTGPVPELAVRFSNGQRLLSMVMAAEDPQWSIRLSGRTWILAAAGRLFLDDGGPESLSEEERAVLAAEEAAAARWGTPVAEPRRGRCTECQSFVRLAGETHLLDFGVCAESTSPFDGRVVALQSGCPSFR